PLVVPDEPVVTRQALQPVLPDTALDVLVEPRHPVGGLEQRWTGTHRCIGDAHAVARDAEADLLVQSWVSALGRTLLGLVHLGHDPIAATRAGADHLRPPPVAPDRRAGRFDPAGEGGLADEAIAPPRFEQLGLRDNSIAMVEQVGEDVEPLRFDMRELPVPP